MKNETTNAPLISVVSPVYKGEKMVHALVERIVAALSEIGCEYEIYLVNDASPDNSWPAILAECAQNERVKGLNLSRNFGQHYAISAGLAYVKGEWVVVMDCDLQDRPEEIVSLFNKAQEGYEIVLARRIQRQDTGLKKLSGWMYHKALDILSDTHTDRTISNFGIYHRKVIRTFNSMPEKSRSFQSLIRYMGYRIAKVDVLHAERMEGSSSYSLKSLLKLTYDIIISNSNKPLRMAVTLGFGMSVISFILALYNVIAKWAGIIHVKGYTTTIFSIWFVGGLLLLVMGILGLYIGKIFDQVKGRPIYIVMDEVNI